MREVGAFEAKTHLSALLDEAVRGETIIITSRGRPVARLTAPQVHDLQAAIPAVKTLRDLRKRIDWVTTQDILQMRNEGRPWPFPSSNTP